MLCEPKVLTKKNFEFFRLKERKVESFFKNSIYSKFLALLLWTYDRGSVDNMLANDNFNWLLVPFFFLAKIFVQTQALEGFIRENKYFRQVTEGSCNRHPPPPPPCTNFQNVSTSKNPKGLLDAQRVF